jgi:hypothetical protein
VDGAPSWHWFDSCAQTDFSRYGNGMQEEHRRCIFDNTAAQAAWDDARKLRRLLSRNYRFLVGTGVSEEHS